MPGGMHGLRRGGVGLAKFGIGQTVPTGAPSFPCLLCGGPAVGFAQLFAVLVWWPCREIAWLFPVLHLATHCRLQRV